MAPDNPDVKLLWNDPQFRQALVANDAVARNEAAAQVEAMRETLPDDILIARVLIENNLLEQRYSPALEEVDRALALAPDREDLLRTRLVLLAQLGMDTDVETQLGEMIASNPEDTESKQALIRWFMSRGETEKADAILREDATREDATTEERVTYVAFVRGVKGTMLRAR
jgi:cellulose synthase operon protein C